MLLIIALMVVPVLFHDVLAEPTVEWIVSPDPSETNRTELLTLLRAKLKAHEIWL